MPVPSLIYVVLVEMTVVAILIITGSRPTLGHATIAGGLMIGAIVHAEVLRRSEHLRDAGSGETTHTTTDTVWIFAALMLVPLSLVAALTVATRLHRILRVTPHSQTYRAIFSTCTSVLASAVAALMLDLGNVRPDELAHDPYQVAWVLAAVLTRDVVGLGLILPAILLQPRPPRLRPLLGTWTEHLVETGTSAFGVALAIAVATAPALLPVFALQVVVLGYAARLPAAERRARIDGKTGLLTATTWRRVAEQDLARARRFRQPVALLMVDIDHFKHINDQRGHLAGDTALRAVATTITAHLNGEGIAGRFGGEEFAILLRGISEEGITEAAENLRKRVADLGISATRNEDDQQSTLTVTVSIGCSRLILSDDVDPDMTLTKLLLAADKALFRAKASGRNQIHLAAQVTPIAGGGGE